MIDRRLAATAVIVGIILAAVGGAIAPAHAANYGVAAARPASMRSAVGGRAFGTRGVGNFGGRRALFVICGERRILLMVTGVNGTTIDATTRGGRSVTVMVDGSTTYREAGASASLSDVHAGSVIAVCGIRGGPNAIHATRVMILLPHLRGVVTAVNGSTLTVTGFDGTTHTIRVNAQTRYERADQSVTLSDVKVGTAVVAVGTENTDGSFSARLVMLELPHVVGQVTAINGSSISVLSPSGTTYTVITSTTTSYAAPGGAPASASSVQPGTLIGAEGTLSANGKTLSALRIVVLPAPGGASGGMWFRYH